jgi:hypothetical protein
MPARTILRSVAMVALVAGFATPAVAATFAPTRFDDPVPNGCQPTDCSLREAVIAANATTATDTILLSAGVYQLTQPAVATDALGADLDVSAPLSVVGAGAAATAIRSGHTTDAAHTRVVEVHGTSLELRHLALWHGGVAGGTGGSASGGCLHASGATVVLEQVLVDTCRADVGGGISLARSRSEWNAVTVRNSLGRSAGGALALTGSSANGKGVVLDGNGSNMVGGAVQVASSSVASTMSWADSLIVGNQATQGGGLHVASSARLDLQGVGGLLRVNGNRASQSGGGFLVAGELVAQRLGVAANTATVDGGGLHATGRSTVRDSEFAFNSSGRDGGGAALRSGGSPSGGHVVDRVSFVDNAASRNGGGLSVLGTFATLHNLSTFSNDAASGGGIEIAGTMRLEHASLLADSGGALRVAGGTVFLRNTVMSGGCVFGAGGNLSILGGNAQALGPGACPLVPQYPAAVLGLAYGPVGGAFDAVHFTAASSPLRNGGVTGGPVTLDIRGAVRAWAMDIGAWEWP